MQSAIKTATSPHRANASTTTGPALAAAMPGSTKMPAQIIVPIPIDMAAPRPSSRASLVLVSEFSSCPFGPSATYETPSRPRNGRRRL